MGESRLAPTRKGLSEDRHGLKVEKLLRVLWKSQTLRNKVGSDKVKCKGRRQILPSRLVVGRLPLKEDILGSNPSSATKKSRPGGETCLF